MRRVGRRRQRGGVLGWVMACATLWVLYIGATTAWRDSQAESARATAQAAAKQAAEQSSRITREKCQATLAALKASAAELISAKRPWEAFHSIDTCATALADGDLASIRAAAKQAAHKADATNLRNSPANRLRALEVLEANYPEEAKKLPGLRRQLTAQIARDEEGERRRLAAEKRKEGVRLGMSQEDVLASSWGRPRKINRTTNVYGVREQWVYDGGYLYFQDGVLTSIQN